VTKEMPFTKAGLPVSQYDIFGYITPGGTLLFSIYLYEICVRSMFPENQFPQNIHTPIWTTLRLLLPHRTDLAISTLFIAAVIGSFYICGHIIAAGSSFLIDRVFVSKGYGYPYESLLNLANQSNRRLPNDEPFYRGIFFWTNILLLLFYLYVSLLVMQIFKTMPFVIAIPIWIIIANIILSILAKILGNSKNENNKKIKDIANGYLSLAAKPYNILANELSQFIYSRQAFEEGFISKYKALFGELFGLDPVSSQTNNFWLPYIFIKEKSRQLAAMADNWLSLYSFARNLAFSFFLFFMYGMVWLLYYYKDMDTIVIDKVLVIIFFPIVGFLLYAVLLTRYYSLYVSYFTKFVYRAFVYLAEVEQRINSNSK
jgi:hypothetical protein